MTQQVNNLLNPFDKFDPVNGDVWQLHYNHFLNYQTSVTGVYTIGWVSISESVYTPLTTLDDLSKENCVFSPHQKPVPQIGQVICEISNHRRLRRI